ncbi:ATP-dependent DNA helicase RecG [Lachnospiraceae bacterium RM5]|nr:ATP-dependent DNA helicase RecG [Lachnospiraceae bacterium RM5]
MKFFDYDTDTTDTYYYEKLQFLIENWEDEIVEFKEAKGSYDFDKIGKYFSALSNEANLRNRQNGWLIFGVSEDKSRHIVGTNFKKGDRELLEKFKYEVGNFTTDELSFIDIIELKPRIKGKEYRVLMFCVPAAAVGIPTEWKNRCWARNGSSLVLLQQAKIDIIRSEERLDWTKGIVAGATIDSLDKEAISLAREKYKKKMNRPHISEEVDSYTDMEFLTKVKLMVDGKITRAAMILLGREECDYLLNTPPTIMWRLYSGDGSDRDYCIYTVPFINVVDKIFTKIRNITYRYMPNQMTLFPQETQQYDTWILRELLNNTIAHSNYQLGGRIYFNEFEDYIIISNPGNFLPENVERVLQPAYNPPYHRNPLLAESMVKFNMIDTATSGIRKVYKIQKDKYFPMPDYDLENSGQVSVKIYGKTLDMKYTHILFDNPDLPLEVTYLLDKVQKGQGKELSDENIKLLRKNGFIEGRKGNLYLSSGAAAKINEKVQYIKNRGFDDQYYKDMIVKYLKKYKKGQKKDFKELIWDKLPESLDENQKNDKIRNLLQSMKRSGTITTDSDNQQKSNWILCKEELIKQGLNK